MAALELRRRMRFIHALRDALNRLHRQIEDDRAQRLIDHVHRLSRVQDATRRLEHLRRQPRTPPPTDRLARLNSSLVRELRDARHDLDRSLEDHGLMVPMRRQRFGPSSLPSVRLLWDELDQVAEDFGGYTIDRRGRELSVRTEPIQLEGWDLGPFEIRLWLDELPESHRRSPYAVEALRPCPAAGSPEVTHPHVSGGRMCEGESTMAIRRALIDGRIADFFLLIRGVLRTYNPESPFVSLDEWDDQTCHDCGGRCGDLCFCDVCERDYCDDCSFYCDVMHRSVCYGCGKEAAPDGTVYHPDAVTRCDGCDNDFVHDDLDDAGRCPDCAVADPPPPEAPEAPPPEVPNPAQDRVALADADSTSGRATPIANASHPPLVA